MRGKLGLQRLGSRELRVFLARWVPIGMMVGIATGVFVAFLNVVIFDYAWNSVKGLYTAHNWLAWVLLPAAFLLSAVLVRTLNPRRFSHGTEEVLSAYHVPGTQIRSLPFARRTAGSIATIGAGGSAGLEGPAILTGAWFASFFVRHVRAWSFDEEDRRVLILVGAAAGVAAVFRAPLTGLLFSLEVPYKSDLAKNAFVPGLLASATSYVTFSALVDPRPIFVFVAVPEFRLIDLAWVAGVGVLTGILAWAFVKLNRLVRATFRHPRVPWELGAMGGGAIVAGAGILSLTFFGEPLALGPGYDLIARLFESDFTLRLLVILLALKVASTLFTLGTYGIGGIFFQSFLIGGLVGAVLHEAAALYADVADPRLFITAGMASFLAAVYKTPIAATTFVAEGTASALYVIPAFIAAAVSYVVSGSDGISETQVTQTRVRYDVLAGLKVKDAMQSGVIAVPADLGLEDFLNDWVLRYRHVAYPVTEKGNLVGWITLEHASAFPAEARRLSHVQDAMSKDVPQAFPEEPLLDVLRRMQQQGASRLLVVEAGPRPKLLGVIAETDLLRQVQLRSQALTTQ